MSELPTISKESANINGLRKRLEEHGYKLYGITYFSTHDRVNFGNKQVKISLNLRGKISELAFETLVNAVEINKRFKPTICADVCVKEGVEATK